jgi:hypothetical protein
MLIEEHVLNPDPRSAQTRVTAATLVLALVHKCSTLTTDR